MRPNNQESSENQRRHPDLNDKRIIKNSEIKNEIQTDANQEKKEISDIRMRQNFMHTLFRRIGCIKISHFYIIPQIRYFTSPKLSPNPECTRRGTSVW